MDFLALILTLKSFIKILFVLIIDIFYCPFKFFTWDKWLIQLTFPHWW